MAMRVGWILKAGDFLRGSAELSAALRLLLLVLFLQKQEKYEQEQFDKFLFVEQIRKQVCVLRKTIDNQCHSEEGQSSDVGISWKNAGIRKN